MIALFALLLQAPTASLPGQATAPVPSAQLPSGAIFLFGRARYFHDVVNARDCVRRFPQPTAALRGRFDTDRAALMRRFGDPYFAAGEVDPKLLDPRRPCDSGTLAGLEDKLVAIEQLLAESSLAGDKEGP